MANRFGPGEGSPVKAVYRGDVAPLARQRETYERRLSRSAIIWMIVWVAVVVPLFFWGIDYYELPMVERAYSPLHDAFKPAGVIGHGLGIAGTTMLIFGVLLYSVRKRVRAFERIGTLRSWLRFHIFLCTLGPALVLLHTTFRFGGLVSIAFWSMTAVVASGLFGRYVYAHIPKSVNGRFRSLRALRDEQRALVGDMEASSGFSAAEINEWLGPPPAYSTGLLPAITSMLRFDLAPGRTRNELRGRVSAYGLDEDQVDELIRLASRHRRLDLERALLEPVQRLFKYWHAFHMPLAILMLVIVVVHVAVALMFGYGWVFTS